MAVFIAFSFSLSNSSIFSFYCKIKSMETVDTRSDFSLKILTQDWLGNEPQQFDLCSHGQVSLIIGGQIVLDGRETYGLSESALALLRTLEMDHSQDHPVAEKLIFHGCGTILMQGCPIGVDWAVKHDGEMVWLSNVKRWDSPDAKRPTLFPALQVVLPQAYYRDVVMAFARQVQQFFRGKEKEFIDEQDRSAYLKFWLEFDSRCDV